VMMLTLGVALFGTTVLLPQFMQIMMGYTAQQSGMALSPGGVVVILLLPLVGTLVSKFDARYLIAFGFTALSLSLFYMTSHLYQGIDFKTAMLLRIYQSVGMAFLFVPINTLVYSGVAPEKNNSVSGIVNLSRNMGGDVGIAFVTTLIARRSQKHQMDLSSHTTGYDHRATAAMYRQLVGQATVLAYIDALKVLAIATALMVPLLSLTRKPRGAPASVGH
jgi:DHA2 family multidrug resistance protein